MSSHHKSTAPMTTRTASEKTAKPGDVGIRPVSAPASVASCWATEFAAVEDIWLIACNVSDASGCASATPATQAGATPR